MLWPSIGFGLVTASVLALASTGFTLQFGISNLLNLAYGDTMTASAFAAYLANERGANLWEMLVVAAVFGGVFSVLLNRCLYTPFRRHGTNTFGLIIVSLSASVIIQNALLGGFGSTFFTLKLPQSHSYHFGSMTLTLNQLFMIGLAIVAMATLHVLLTRTRLGKAMRATSRNPDLARACGINTSRVTDVAWLVSGGLCGIAGAVLVINTSSFQSTTGNDFLILTIAAAMLGGVGEPYGAMIGAIILGLATEITAGLFLPSLREVFAFVILIVVLLIRPQGLWRGASSRLTTAK